MAPFPRWVTSAMRSRFRWAVAAALVLGGGVVVWQIGKRDDAAQPTRPETSAASAAQPPGEMAGEKGGQQAAAPEKAVFVEARREMLQRQLRRRGIENARVLDAMGKVPRHRFVADHLQAEAYDDHPLPIGRGQTISQPYVVALMTELASPKPGDRALDVGTGSGYQAAVLSELCKDVYGIEIVEPLAEQAKKRLADCGYANVTVRAGDGYRGWPEHAPFDVIILAAAADRVPPALIEQLAKGGRLVLPVGRHPQQLMLIEKLADGTIRQRPSIPVMFVPMTGESQREKRGPAEE